MPDLFLQQGSYQYLLNGQPVAVEEGWSQQPGADGSVLCNSWRRAPGVEIHVEAQLHGGLVTGCDVSWRGEQQVSSSYRAGEGCWQIKRSVNGASTEQLDVAVQAGPQFLFPLMRIYSGPLIAAMLGAGGSAEVIVPDITQPDNQDILLKPRCSQRQAQVLDQAAQLELDGEIYRCRLCEYTGDQYAAGSLFWLDDTNRLLRYCWQQGEDKSWEVNLRV